MSRKQSKRRGWFCWACGRNRPNEKFSGKGRAKHVCKDCARLGSGKLSALQAMRDLDRCTIDGCRIRRGRRGCVERFLNHEDEQVRQYAMQLHLFDLRRQLKLRLKGEVAQLLRTLAGEGLEVVAQWSDWDDPFDDEGFEEREEYEEYFEESFEEPCED